MRVADKTLQGVTCIRIDATVTPAYSEKELAEGNFKGFGHYPLLAFCDNTGGEPLAWMLRKGSAGSNTAADHIAMVDASVAALPPAWRRNVMVTVDGAGFSHKLLEHLDKLASRRGHTQGAHHGQDELGEAGGADHVDLHLGAGLGHGHVGRACSERSNLDQRPWPVPREPPVQR